MVSPKKRTSPGPPVLVAVTLVLKLARAVNAKSPVKARTTKKKLAKL